MVSPYPLFHMGAWTIALQQWQGRDTLVLLDRTDGPSMVAAVERHRATRLNCIPALWQRILDHLGSDAGRSADVSSVRFADTGTSATPLELLRAMASAFPNAQVRVFYGSTESGGVTMLEHADIEAKPGSCGVPAPYAEVRLADTGELLVRTVVMFDGYFGNPAATAEVLQDGWYRSGDLAEIDADGYVTIVGRARDIIRTGGETVAPAEVENIVAQHPAVADVAVVGVPDVQWGEVVCAVIVAAQGASVPPVTDLRSFCEGKLASHKHPRAVAAAEVIPRTASTNQVQRRLLVEQLATGALALRL
jgi:acyl-CoA synthetase (AMP-forming)/AMP-acid ligase II